MMTEADLVNAQPAQTGGSAKLGKKGKKIKVKLRDIVLALQHLSLVLGIIVGLIFIPLKVGLLPHITARFLIKVATASADAHP